MGDMKMKKYFIFIFCFLAIITSCNNTVQPLNYDFYITNESGHDVSITLKIDGESKVETFAADDKEKRTYLYKKSINVALDFKPPTPCVLSRKDNDLKIKKTEPISVQIENTSNENVKVSSIDFNLPAADREKLLKNAIFGDIEIPAVIINTMSIDVYFHKLKEEPSYCSNITVYTNSSTVKAAFHYDDVKKKIILKTEKAN